MQQMHISAVRNLSYLPAAILYILAGAPLFFLLMCVPRRKYATSYMAIKEREAKRRINEIGDFIAPGDHVLDVGCGNGKFGEALATRFGAEVRGVDVVDYADADIPIELYDGVSLPFEDNSFDVIVMAMMLHHVSDQEELLNEAIRCSRRGLIIYEDTYFSPWQRIAVIWNDFYTNIVVGVVSIFKGTESKGVLKMPLPFTFRCIKGWHALFKEKSLTIRDTVVHHLGMKPHSKVTFLLSKQPVLQPEPTIAPIGPFGSPFGGRGLRDRVAASRSDRSDIQPQIRYGTQPVGGP